MTQKLPQQNNAQGKGINWHAVEQFLRENIPNLPEEKLVIKKFSAGYSNLTYLVKVGHWEAVLRRPPFGPIPPKAHNMEREYRILRNVHPVFPLAPKPYVLCEDNNVMDRHFYVMEKKDGVVIDDSIPKEYGDSRAAGKVISESFVETLVNLHSINIEQAGLTDIGRPQGYLERQVQGWITRYNQAKTDDIPGVEQIEKWLLNHVPESPNPTIVHNDFKLNNMMFSQEKIGVVVGVFDWEMCTIGDPLTDLAGTLAYWTEKGDGETGLTAITKQPGFISRKELLELYSKKSQVDLSNIDYYLTFAFYKVAAVLQQIYYRWKIGEASDNRFEKLGTGVSNLMRQAELAQKNKILT